MPGTDFSMAFLLVETHVVDWASCWTDNRTASQELLLGDVDHDGYSDVGFRASKGFWVLEDKRQHSWPGDKQKWLYAYAITAGGFQSLFPVTGRDLKVQHTYETANQLVVLQIRDFPESLRERQMIRCALHATNNSERNIAIEPARWFRTEISNAGYFMSPDPPRSQRHQELRLACDNQIRRKQ